MKTRIRTAAELRELIEEIGYLPLFAGIIPGFSVQEYTDPKAWFTGDNATDPWQWREQLAADRRLAYGKLFAQKAGFISRAMLPAFCNLRRDGYDFDARWDDGQASYRQKHIMDLFLENETLPAYAMKQMAGFGKDGEKGFEGTLTQLQMQTYLLVHSFQRKTNRKGEPYGLPGRQISTPEALFGAEEIAAGYAEKPADTQARLLEHCRRLTGATEAQARRLISG